MVYEASMAQKVKRHWSFRKKGLIFRLVREADFFSALEE